MRRAMREIIRLSTEWDAVVAALGPHAHPGLSPSESVAEVVAALEQAQAMYETSHASRVHADGCVLRLEAERDALRAELDRPKHETLRQLADAVERNAALKAERDALRLAVAKLEDERKFWAGGDAMARLKANDLRAEVERLERARLRSGDWLTLDKLDAEVAAAKDAQIEALLENVDLRAEVEEAKLMASIEHSGCEKALAQMDDAVSVMQAQKARAERAEAALTQIAAWSWDSGSTPAPEVVSRIYCEARAALRDTAPAEEGKP